MTPCCYDLLTLQLAANAAIYSSASSWLLIKDPSASSVSWNLEADVGAQVIQIDAAAHSKCDSAKAWWRKLHFARRHQILFLINRSGRVVAATLSVSLCTPLAGCMSPRSQSRTLTAQSFQLLNNTKQTLTYFQSREQAQVKTWSGIRLRSGLRAERRRGGALTEELRHWFVLRPRRKEAGLRCQDVSSKHGLPCELVSPLQSARPSLTVACGLL